MIDPIRIAVAIIGGLLILNHFGGGKEAAEKSMIRIGPKPPGISKITVTCQNIPLDTCVVEAINASYSHIDFQDDMPITIKATNFKAPALSKEEPNNVN